MAKTKVNATEVDAYIFIKENLKELGWDVRNPSRHQSGQVYTQNECLSHPEIKATLVLQKPENVVKITDTVFWVIEAKREHRQLEQALQTELPAQCCDERGKQNAGRHRQSKTQPGGGGGTRTAHSWLFLATFPPLSRKVRRGGRKKQTHKEQR